MSTTNLRFLVDLEELINERRHTPGAASYTTSLFESGTKRIAQKVGEEGVELALAAVSGDMDEIINEAADLLYHTLVLLAAENISLATVVQRLQSRHTEGN